MTETGKPMVELTGLLEERARYEGWLAQLEQRRQSTPAHVFERVHTDYSSRLQGVNERLGARASELEETAATLAAQVARLFDEENARRDERAEAELRAAVGELTDEQALEVIGRCDDEIARVGSERETLGSELAVMQGVLAQVTAPRMVEEPAVAEALEAAPADDVLSVDAYAPDPEPVVLEVPAAPAAQRPATPADTASFDELAFLQSVVEPRQQSPAVPVAAVPAPIEEEELLPPPVLSAVRRPSVPTPVTAPSVPRDSQPNGVAARAKLTPGTLPAFMKDMQTEQIKTLKCQECGTMNYPTEWYCERCGGELAAM